MVSTISTTGVSSFIYFIEDIKQIFWYFLSPCIAFVALLRLNTQSNNAIVTEESYIISTYCLVTASTWPPGPLTFHLNVIIESYMTSGFDVTVQLSRKTVFYRFEFVCVTISINLVAKSSSSHVTNEQCFWSQYEADEHRAQDFQVFQLICSQHDVWWRSRRTQLELLYGT